MRENYPDFLCMECNAHICCLYFMTSNPGILHLAQNIYVVPVSQEILTKDNLIKRNWTWNGKCCFCDNKESIQHFLFDCLFAKIVWHIIHITFGLAPPKNITNLFGNRLKGISRK
jgi:hypothetical protein